MSKSQLMQLNIKQLKDYISLYNIPSTAGQVVEKQDLINLVKSFDLKEENQQCFRSKIIQFSQKSASIENIFSDLFSIPIASSSHQSPSSSTWQQNISNSLPIFFQELFTAQPLAPDTSNVSGYPGNSSTRFTEHPPPDNTTPPHSNHSNRTHPYTFTSTASSESKPSPTPVTETIPTVPQIIKDKIDIKTLSSKTLKAILKKYNVDYGGILEKSELEVRVQTLLQNMRLEALQANEDLLWYF